MALPTAEVPLIHPVELIKIDANTPDLEPLKRVWSDVPKKQQFEEKYGCIAELLNVKVDFSLLKAAMSFYEPAIRGFVLKDIVLIPTLEEYAALLKIPAKKNGLAVFSNLDHLNHYKQLGNILGIQPEKAKDFEVARGKTKGVDWFHLKNIFFPAKGVPKILEGLVPRFTAFGIYALVLFPSAKKVADVNLIKAFGLLESAHWDPVPALLAETFRALNHCKRKGEGHLRCCVQLLYIWLITHLPTGLCTLMNFTSGSFKGGHPIREFCKVNWPKKKTEEWQKILALADSSTLNLIPRWFYPEAYVWMCDGRHWVPLLGIRGAINYVPALAFRQFQDTYVTLHLEGLEGMEFDYDGSSESKWRIRTVEKSWKSRETKVITKARTNADVAYVSWHLRQFRNAQIYKIISEIPKSAQEMSWEEQEILKKRKRKEKEEERASEEATRVLSAQLRMAETEISRLLEDNQRISEENSRLRQESTNSQLIQTQTVQRLRSEMLQLSAEVHQLKNTVREQETENLTLGASNERYLKLWQKEKGSKDAIVDRLVHTIDQHEKLYFQMNMFSNWGIEVIPRIQKLRTRAAELAELCHPLMESRFVSFAMEVLEELREFKIDRDLLD